jgi:hypothetical protein
MRSIVRARPARLIAVLAVLALAGCQSTPPATSSPVAPTSVSTPEITAAPPSPTAAAAVDVVKAFAAKANDLDSGVISFEGTERVGLVQVQLSGSSTFSGPDNRTLTTTTVGGVQTQVETVQVAGKRYVKNGDGPYLEVPIVASSGDLGSQVNAAAKGALTDQGTEQRQGQTVHKLVPAASAGFDPTSLVSGVSGVEGLAAGVAFYVAEDGTPVTATITATWTQKVGGQSVNASLEFNLVFSHVGQAQTVNIPTDVWQRFSSPRYQFSMARPAEWTYFKGKDNDEFDAPYYAYILANRHKTNGVTVNAIAKFEASSLKSFIGGKPVANDGATVGGATGRLLSGSGKAKSLGKTVQTYEAVIVKGAFVYYILWVSEAGHAADDLALFREMLGTVTLG